MQEGWTFTYLQNGRFDTNMEAFSKSKTESTSTGPPKGRVSVPPPRGARKPIMVPVGSTNPTIQVPSAAGCQDET